MKQKENNVTCYVQCDPNEDEIDRGKPNTDKCNADPEDNARRNLDNGTLWNAHGSNDIHF